jgi:hypothetical protein
MDYDKSHGKSGFVPFRSDTKNSSAATISVGNESLLPLQIDLVIRCTVDAYV